MTGFVAEGAVEPLGWNFHPYVASEGTIPEPSQVKLDAYSRAMLGIFVEMGLDLPATSSEEDIDKALMAKLGADRSLSEVAPDIEALHEKIRKARIKAASAVCSGKPTIEHITKLPPRVREMFLGYVASWAADPTMPQAATRPSLATSRNGTAVT